MQQAQVLIYETDGKLAELLRPVCAEHGWRLRELRDRAVVCTAAQEGGVLLLQVGRDLQGELSLLAEVQRLAPATAVLVASDVANAPLAGLAWELGASMVLQPPFGREQLRLYLRGFLQTEQAT